MIRQPATHGMMATRIRRCGVALGSNLGDRLHHLRLAARALDQLADFSQPVLRAPVYETDPMDCAPGTPASLNSVIEIGYFGEPPDLLERLRAIEAALGRPAARERNAPRVLDLDLLYADDLVVDTPDLQLPHPRLHERRFVLEPLAEVRPHLRLPGHSLSVSDLLGTLPLTAPPLRLITRDWP
jgi:2-amino-4-hydroxy-6-hydroxymethyldihydropteridine diphosphokinase